MPESTAQETPVPISTLPNVPSISSAATSSTHSPAITRSGQFSKAKAAGFNIHVVLESNDYHDLITGNYRSQFRANSLEANIWWLQVKYGARFSYVKDPNDAPRFIVNYLFTLLKVALKNWY